MADPWVLRQTALAWLDEPTTEAVLDVTIDSESLVHSPSFSLSFTELTVRDGSWFTVTVLARVVTSGPWIG